MGVWFGTFAPAGDAQVPAFEHALVYAAWVSPGYFRTMGIPLLYGRDFVETDADDADANPIIVNAEWARRMWSDEQIVGRRFAVAGGDGPTFFTVVGVIADARLTGPAADHGDVQAFLPRGEASAQLYVLQLQ